MLQFIERSVEAPQAIKDAASKILDNSKTVTHLEFVWKDPNLNCQPGMFIPELGLIIVDFWAMFHFNATFMKRGFNLFSSVWACTLFTIIHNAIHARQVEKNPALSELEAPTDEMELEANATAWKWTMAWFRKNHMPRFLDEWGTLGNVLEDFHKDNGDGQWLGEAEWSNELQMLLENTAADVETLLQLDVLTLDEAKKLDDEVQHGRRGKVICNRSCLSPWELMDLITDDADKPKPTKEESKMANSLPIMSAGKKINFMLHIHNLLHSGKSTPTIDTVWTPWVKYAGFKKFMQGTLPACDITLDDGAKEVQLRFVTQNPQKRDNQGNLSFFAVQAQQGHKITHVFGNGEGNYVGRIHNGSFVKPKKEGLYRNTKPAPKTMVAGMASDDSSTPPPYVDPNNIDTFVEGAC